VLGFCAVAGSAAAKPVALAPPLAGLSFLVGDWTSGRGQVADTGGTATGSSVITPEAGGAVLLRRDHTQLFSAAGAPAGGFDQIMMIFAEAGAVHADYADGTHVIHYVSAAIEPGKSVVFASAAGPGVPVFRLGYWLEKPGTLRVTFSMQPPGAPQPRPIATGTLSKRR
jgi:hypothetical protein